MIFALTLRMRLCERKMDVRDLAEKAAIPKTTLYRKMNNPRTMTLIDLAKIRSALRLTPTELDELTALAEKD